MSDTSLQSSGPGRPKDLAKREAILEAAKCLFLRHGYAGSSMDAIAAGGSSLRDYRQADGELGYFQHAFAVYGREGLPCLRPGCGGEIRRAVQSGRSSFFCPVCQD